MTDSTQWFLLIAGVLAIGGLSVVIRSQLLGQQVARQAHEQRLAELQAEAQKQRDYLENSVRVIAAAMKDDQCEVVEGSIRLKKLLDHLAPYLHEHETFGVFNRVYELTKHVPMLEKWKALEPQQRDAYRNEMADVEKDHKEQVITASTALISYRFEQ